MNECRKVDFHSHLITKTYRSYLEEYVGGDPDGFPTPAWSVESQIAGMDKLGICFAFLSVSSPNFSLAEREDEARLVRASNIEGLDVVQSCPDRLGLFASLPLPHVAESLEEAAFALDELHVDGFGLSTHYAGVYLGDASYDPVMEYLNQRRAVVAVHPTEPAALPPHVNEELPIPAMEFLMDTTRTFTAMVMADVFGRYPGIRWIFPHTGAFLPLLSDRMQAFSTQFRGKMSSPRPVDFKADMRRVYFDLAGFSAPKQLHDLLLDVDCGNLLYGSDTPYTPLMGCLAQTGALENSSELTDRQKSDVFAGNAVALVPRLEQILGIPADGGTRCYADEPLTATERRGRVLRSAISRVYDKVFG